MKEFLELFLYIALTTSAIEGQGRKKLKYLGFVKQNYATFSKGFKLLTEEFQNISNKSSGRSFKGRNIEGTATFKSMQPENNADLDEILKGVKAAGVSGFATGLLDVFGYNAFPILAGDTWYRGIAPAAAAAIYEKGKVVAFGSDIFTQLRNDQADTNTLFLNSINWASRNGRNEKQNAAVLNGYYSSWPDDIMGLLKESGYDGQVVTPEELQTNLTLNDFDILIFPNFYDVKKGAIERVLDYVKNGGGFVSGYQFTEPDFVGNEILRRMGMAHIPDDDWLRVYMHNTPTKMFTVSKDMLIGTHSGWNAKDIIKLFKSKTSVEDIKPHWNHITDIVRLSLEFSNQTDLEWLPEFQEIVLQLFTSGESIEKSQSEKIWDMVNLMFKSDTKWLTKFKTTIMKLIEEGKANLTESASNAIADVLKTSLKYEDPSNNEWLVKFKDVIISKSPNISESNPLNVTNYDRLLAILEHSLFNDLLKPEEIYIHPSAWSFPGIPDKSTDKERDKSRTITIPLKNNPDNPVYEWKSKGMGYSTKLYAPPGSIISLVIKGNIGFKFEVRIGCHTDGLTHKEKWTRFPIIRMKQNFEGNSATIASPFGGLIYIENIKAVADDGTITNFTFDITGAIPTPSFVLDETSLIDWKESIRFIKAPYAEFESEIIRISVSEKLAKSIENPEQALLYWTNSLNQMSDFIRLPRQNNFQSFAYDIDISAGFLHSGQPIMGYRGTAPEMFDKELFCTREMHGFFHEMGHNLQAVAWTLEDEGEVSNNIFVRYMLNNYCLFKMEHTRYGGTEVKDNNEDMKKYIEKGGTYKEDFDQFWNIFYYQIITKFGWGVLRKSFNAYSSLSENPSNNDEKMNTGLVLYSIAANRNLAGFFKSWGLPISEEAIAKVAHLPESSCLMTDLLIKEESLEE